MQKILLYSGWILAAVGIAGSLVFYRQINTLKTEKQALANEMLALSQAQEAKAALASEKAASLPEEITPPNATIATLPDTFNLDRVVGDMIQDMSVEPEADNTDGRRGIRKQDESGQEDQNNRLEVMKQRYMDARFKGLLETLNLSPERSAELQALLQTHADRVFDIRRMEREGLISQEEANIKLAALDGEMQSQLGAMLAPQEMAQYQEYEATEPERRMTHTLSLQIKDHSDMAPALRNKLVASFHNQLLNESANPENGIPLDPFTRSNVAYAHTLEQLSGELSPEEYAQAQAFMEERLRMQSAMVERMSNWDVNRYPGGGPWGHLRISGDERRGQGNAGKPKF